MLESKRKAEELVDIQKIPHEDRCDVLPWRVPVLENWHQKRMILRMISRWGREHPSNIQSITLVLSTTELVLRLLIVPQFKFWLKPHWRWKRLLFMTLVHHRVLPPHQFLCRIGWSSLKVQAGGLGLYTWQVWKMEDPTLKCSLAIGFVPPLKGAMFMDQSV